MSRKLVPIVLLSTIALSACAAATSTASPVTEPVVDPIITPNVDITDPPATTETVSPTSTDPQSVTGAARTFVIDASQSSARFLIDEVLAGQAKTVVGTTRSVEGSFSANLSNTSSITYTPVRVDMSTLVTDSEMRNRTLHGTILETGNPNFQYAEFVPTSISGLPAAVEVGAVYPIELSGNLTLHGVTNAVTFQGPVTVVSDRQINGLLSFTFNYEIFNINILRLPPQVASVGDKVTLELEFVALAQ